MNKISFILISRSRPNIFLESVNSIMKNATQKVEIEIVCRLDFCDPFLRQYLDIEREYVRYIVGPRERGYFDYYKMIEECARLSTGDLMWQWGDDVEMLTSRFDEIIWRRIAEAGLPFYVASTAMESNRPGADYRFAFFAIPRLLYEATGKKFSLNQEIGYDRVYDALAHKCKFEVISGATVRHVYHGDVTASEGISKVEKMLETQLPQLQREWGQKATAVAERLGVPIC